MAESKVEPQHDSTNGLDLMNILDEDEVLHHHDHEIIKGEIDLVDYALKDSKLYDLQKINKQQQDDNKQVEVPQKYKDLYAEYQVILELELKSENNNQNTNDFAIGALIPKGYVLLNNNNIWFDSVHNLLLKNA